MSTELERIDRLPTFIIVGFKDSGKSNLYLQLEKLEKKCAFIFDSDQFPASVIKNAEDKKYTISEKSIKSTNGSITALLDEESVQTSILPEITNLEALVFISSSFDSNYIYELLSIVSDSPLSELADRVAIANVICTINTSTFLEDVSTKEKLKDRFHFKDIEGIFELDECCAKPGKCTRDTSCCVDGKCSKQETEKCCANGKCSISGRPIKTDCCANGKCSKQETENCCVDGKCSKQETENCCVDGKCKISGESVKEDCCKDGKCTNEQNSCKEDCCDDHHDHDHEDEELVDKAETRISALLISQIKCSDIIFLNNYDETPKEKVEYIEKLVGLFSYSVKKTKVITFDDLMGTVFSRDYKPINESAYNLNIANYYQRKPFHPERLFNYLYKTIQEKGEKEGETVETFTLQENVEGLIYLFGGLWLASDMNYPYFLEFIDEYGDDLMAEIFQNERPFESTLPSEQQNPALKGKTEKEIALFKFHDRKTEFGLLGNKDFNMKEFIEGLDKCLLTEAEMEQGPSAWESYPNPFEENGFLDEDYEEESGEEDEEI